MAARGIACCHTISGVGGIGILSFADMARHFTSSQDEVGSGSWDLR